MTIKNIILTPKELGIIESKLSCNIVDTSDMRRLLGYIETLEEMLDEGDQEDAFGTEGWRRRIESYTG